MCSPTSRSYNILHAEALCSSVSPDLLQGIQASVQACKAHVLICVLLAACGKSPLLCCHPALVLLHPSIQVQLTECTLSASDAGQTLPAAICTMRQAQRAMDTPHGRRPYRVNLHEAVNLLKLRLHKLGSHTVPPRPSAQVLQHSNVFCELCSMVRAHPNCDAAREC